MGKRISKMFPALVKLFPQILIFWKWTQKVKVCEYYTNLFLNVISPVHLWPSLLQYLHATHLYTYIFAFSLPEPELIIVCWISTSRVWGPNCKRSRHLFSHSTLPRNHWLRSKTHIGNLQLLLPEKLLALEDRKYYSWPGCILLDTACSALLIFSVFAKLFLVLLNYTYCGIHIYLLAIYLTCCVCHFFIMEISPIIYNHRIIGCTRISDLHQQLGTDSIVQDKLSDISISGGLGARIARNTQWKPSCWFDRVTNKRRKN